MPSAASVISILFSVIWTYSFYYDFVHQPRLGHTWYFYKLVMLTNLNFVLDVFFSIIVVLPFQRSLKLKKAADFMFYTSIFPVAIVTCALFWGLYAIDPELVMPDWVAKLIPSWLNHVTHTLPIIYVLSDFLLIRRSPPTCKSALRISFLLVSVYFAIIFYVFLVDGYWLYPILSMLSTSHFIAAYFVAVFGYFGLIQLAIGLGRLYWGKSR